METSSTDRKAVWAKPVAELLHCIFIIKAAWKKTRDFSLETLASHIVTVIPGLRGPSLWNSSAVTCVSGVEETTMLTQ
jgi:hypothetical protein